MTIDAEINAVVGSEKVKQKSPDGLDVARYKNINNWTYRRLAWEFLRRNPDFIAACEKVEASTETEKLKVAQEFGLKKFKTHKEKYKGDSGVPKFKIGQISWFENLDSVGKNLRVKTTLGMGQVFIRFDLESAMQDKRALESQLYSAKKHLETWLKEYAEKHQIKLFTHKPQRHNYEKYIQLLDLLESGKKHHECAKILHPDKVAEGYKADELRLLVKNNIEAAKAMARDGYRYLLLAHKKPNNKRKSAKQ